MIETKFCLTFLLIGKTQANVKKRNTNIRMATSSEHLKRSFFENNLCALNLKAPSEMNKASSSKNHSVKEKKREEKTMMTEHSSKAPHISIFRDMENQPEAEQWIKSKGLQTVNNESQEYDGDVFLPTGTESLYLYTKIIVILTLPSDTDDPEFYFFQ